MLKIVQNKSRRNGSQTDKAATTVVPQRDRAETRRDDLATLALGLTGAFLLWAAFPPINLPYLAWIAPVPWIWLIRRMPSLSRWSYAFLWLAGCIHWLLMLNGIRLAHPALYAGWIALAAYLGVYLPAFVGLSRVAVQRLRFSVVIAAPLVWVGLELLRGHLITGFSMGLLAHTQAEFPRLIQISDLAGGYTLSFVVMLIAACISRMIPCRLPAQSPRPHVAWWSVAPVAAILAAALLYGQWRVTQSPPGASGPTANVALIQGSLDTVFEASQARIQETFDHYRRLTAEAVGKHPNLDLVAWPESMFAVSETLVEEPLSERPETGLSTEELRRRLVAVQEDFRILLAGEAERANAGDNSRHAATHLLVGTTTFAYGPSRPRIYNAALLADPSGNVVGRYFKTHPVMFGEYIPFGDALPWLYKLTPMAGGLSIGTGPTIFEIAGLKMSPSICFESTVPHLIRGQLASLANRGTPADVLINVTNDGWFWGTGMLDLHFRCGVFRAVENRKPLLVVANTGISTFVDGSGVIHQRGSRRQPQVLIAQVSSDGRSCLYHSLGDFPAWLCAAVSIGLGLIGIRSGWSP